ncbi:hypothetical protein [Coleofasciculus sp.]|uniref:hypothetical protein n=1 Tax=Coleofasciculus sp. TaxID=3100458 RepID=UPI003A32D267
MASKKKSLSKRNQKVKITEALEAIKERLSNSDPRVQIPALEETFNYGEEGLKLLRQVAKNEQGIAQVAAKKLLQDYKNNYSPTFPLPKADLEFWHTHPYRQGRLLEDYLESKKRYEELHYRWLERSDRYSQETKELECQVDEAKAKVFSPWVLVSRCPYCQKPIKQQGTIVGLSERVWYREYEEGYDTRGCPHLFCLDGALHLNGHQPPYIEYRAPNANLYPNRINMAAEVPFIKPRVLNLPTMVAVIHSLLVEERYTAYWTAYFTQEKPPPEDFCIGFARVRHVEVITNRVEDWHIHKVRHDQQEYDLREWIEQGKVFWIDPHDKENLLVQGKVADFPYHNIPGRRHPYTIEKGEVKDIDFKISLPHEKVYRE